MAVRPGPSSRSSAERDSSPGPTGIGDRLWTTTSRDDRSCRPSPQRSAPPPCQRAGRRSRRPRTRRTPPHNGQAKRRCHSSARPTRRTSKPSPRRSFRPTTRPARARPASCYFIDRALATFLSQLASDYRAQLAEFQAAFREQHPGAASFASLTSEQQIEYLKTVDHTPFFDTTRLLTLLGMFSMPAYGGNRDGVGWKLIGFEDRHVFQPPFGYYDRDYPGFVIDPAKTQ